MAEDIALEAASVGIHLKPEGISIDDRGRITLHNPEILQAVVGGRPPGADAATLTAADTNYGCGWNYQCKPKMQ